MSSNTDTENLIKDTAKKTLGVFSDAYEQYFNTIIFIIIFLTFLNFFIVTYFYFTSLIQSNINKSNCGTGTLEAETFRHIFLQDNTRDKTRDVYFFVIIIFTLYMLYLMLSSYDFENMNINCNDEVIIKNVSLSFILFLSSTSSLFI